MAVRFAAARQPEALRPVYAQSPSDASFLATLGELRDASFADKETIIDQLAQSGHPNVQAVLTALLEDRLYFRNDDQKVFLVKTRAQEDATTLDLIDPLTLKDAGSASVDNLTKIGTNNHLRRVLQTTLARFRLVEPGCVGPLGRGTRHRAGLGRRQRAATARAERCGNRFQSQKGNCHRSGARRSGWFGCAGTSRGDLHAPPQPPPGCAEQTVRL